jgi:hypothetical protein
MRAWSLLLSVTAATLAGCGRAATPIAAQTIPDPVAYLVQLRCPDGRLEVAEPDCPGAAPQRASDPMLMRRRDWPAPDGYVAQDAILGAYGPETLWSFSPSGPFVAAHGDGGEVYVVDGQTVRIALTQDGGKPYLQGFYGAHCGGAGWVAFRADAATGRWASLVAHLSDGRVPSFCLAFSAAFTRYRLEDVSAPWVVDGAVRAIALPTVIAEHYDRGAIADAHNMERSFFAKGVGRIIWEAWTTDKPTGAGLAARCPGTTWSTPPAAGWVLSDCRYATNLVAADGSLNGATFGWPGAVAGPLP